MPEEESSSRIDRYLPHVIVATLAVLLLPSIAVYLLEAAEVITSPVAATIAAVAVSIAFAQVMSTLWMRHSGSRDLVFGDLMLWGWLKRLHTEKRMSSALHLLGVDRSGRAVREVFMSPERQAEILTELAAGLEAGDPFTHGHSRRVTRYAHMIAKTMHLPSATVDRIRTAAAVHDVGKIDTPSEILNKPAGLTDEEFAVMKEHPVRGAEMVDRLGNREVMSIVLHHHERIDGLGYPHGLKGDAIPLGARVIAVADTFDAITSARPYRKGRTHAEAIEIIKRASGTQLDPKVVEAFLAYYSGKRSIAMWMSLSTALQRVVGGFGNWVQHARAGGLSSSAASLGAAVTMTAVAAGVVPVATAPRVPGESKGKEVSVIASDGKSRAGGHGSGDAPGQARSNKHKDRNKHLASSKVNKGKGHKKSAGKRRSEESATPSKGKDRGRHGRPLSKKAKKAKKAKKDQRADKGAGRRAEPGATELAHAGVVKDVADASRASSATGEGPAVAEAKVGSSSSSGGGPSSAVTSTPSLSVGGDGSGGGSSSSSKGGGKKSK